MVKHIVFRIVAGLVLLAAIAGIAFFAYNAGVAHGTTVNLEAPAAQSGTQPLPYYYGFGMHGMPWHVTPFFGFGCFGILVPLFLLFLAFGAMRHMLWGPRWWGYRMHRHGHWGEKGPWGDEVPPMVAEWHRRMHEEPPVSDVDKS